MDVRPADTYAAPAPIPAATSTLPVDVRIPKGAKLLEIQESYSSPDEVQCGLEGCRTPHKRGFLVSFTEQDGAPTKVGMIGNVCGKNTFNTTWIAAERVYDAKVKAAEMEAAKERFLIRAGRIIPELQAATPRLVKLAAARCALAKHGPEIMKICADAVKSRHGRIQVRSGREDVTVHRLRGDNFWLDGGNALFRAKQLDCEVSRFLEYLSSPEATKKEVDRRLGNLHDVEYRWGQISRSLEAAEAGLRPSHLEKVFEAVRLVQKGSPPVPGYEDIIYRDLDLRVRMQGSILECREWDEGSNTVRWIPVVDLG
jgi:hypothetical protein